MGFNRWKEWKVSMGEEEWEMVRRAYYVERKSQRQIAKEGGMSRKRVKQMVEGKEGGTRGGSKGSVYEPYRERVEELLEENAGLPAKQRYTAAKIYKMIRGEGYKGCESRVRQEVGKWKKRQQVREVYLPLAFEPGQDAQCDWGEAVVVMGGKEEKVQVFVMRMCYSRRLFVMAFPTQRRESFLTGHVEAFAYFGGVPSRISYDNVATAVQVRYEGAEGKRERMREERQTFVSFRSHYLFESHFCTPGQAHEKGGVENAVGYSRRDMCVPIPRVKSYEELNRLLLKRCDRENERTVRGKEQSIGALWEEEQRWLRPLPAQEYDCGGLVEVRVTPYSQVTYETNRYSLPVKRGRESVVIKVYPFHIDIVEGAKLLARHARSYERGQDLIEPQHYFPLLKQRPGAFDYALPLKKWKKHWPACYHEMLVQLREKWPEGRGVKEFVGILELHQRYPARVVEMAVKQALTYGCVHVDGVLQCIYQMVGREEGKEKKGKRETEEKKERGGQPLDLARYEELMKSCW
jgi:transposase